MKNTKSLHLIYGILIILFSTISGYFLSVALYWLSGICILISIGLLYRLNKIHYRSVKHLRRFIDAIRFTEFNVSFDQAVSSGLDSELSEKMVKAIDTFNGRLQKNESKVDFYELLLNRIDFSIIVINKKNEVFWINKTALNLIDKPRLRKLEEIESVFPELYKGIIGTVPGKLQTIRLQNKKTNDEFLALYKVSAKIQGEEIAVISIRNMQPVIDEAETEAWKKLIRILTHEMMNSITPILSLADTFSDDSEERDPLILKKALQTIHRRSKGLIQFVNNYQRLTRIPNPVKEDCDIRQILIDITHLMKAQGIEFTYSIAPGLQTIHADRGQIEQVMINLINNAWDACIPDRKPEILVYAGTDDYQRPLITVTDNGTGILQDVQDKVFIPFFSTKKDGSGIGLSICRQIINAHGGTLSLFSEPGKGSCFTIRL